MIAVIVPSRGRPKRAARMADSVHRLSARSSRVIVAIDPDDETGQEYAETIGRTPGAELWVLPERVGYAGTLNHVSERVDADIYGAFGDDVLFRTAAWDQRVAEALVRPGMAFPNDLAHREGWPTAVFMSAAYRAALGYLALPTVWHQYADNAWKALGDATGTLAYLPRVICEHMHEAYGKEENLDGDTTYAQVYSEPKATESRLAFEAWRDEGGMDRDIAAIRAL